MLNAWKLGALGMAISVTTVGWAQIPDLLTAYEAGGRSLGVGSAFGVSTSGTRAALDNPAGLGFVSQPTASLTFKNLNESRTAISRNFVDPDIRTNGQSGDRSLSHAGLTRPLGGGVLGISYTVAGYIRDVKSGTNLRDGGLIYRNFNELLRAKTDMFALSWGRASKDQTSSFGVGVVLASANIRNLQAYQLFNDSGTPNDPNDDVQIPTTPLNNSGTRFGVGVVAGFMTNPSPDLTIGASVRSPIQLSGGDEVRDYYSRIPGRLSLGLAQRVVGPGRADDFMILGVQGDFWFGGREADILSRDGSQVALGFGAEYHYRFREAFVPFRLGYRFIGKGGDGFARLNNLTFGLGYNPDNSNFGVDLDFGSNSGGGMDMSLSMSYRFRN